MLSQELQVSAFACQYDPKVSGLSICIQTMGFKSTILGFLQVSRLNVGIWAEDKWESSDRPSLNTWEPGLVME